MINLANSQNSQNSQNSTNSAIIHLSDPIDVFRDKIRYMCENHQLVSNHYVSNVSENIMEMSIVLSNQGLINSPIFSDMVVSPIVSPNALVNSPISSNIVALPNALSNVLSDALSDVDVALPLSMCDECTQTREILRRATISSVTNRIKLCSRGWKDPIGTNNTNHICDNAMGVCAQHCLPILSKIESVKFIQSHCVNSFEILKHPIIYRPCSRCLMCEYVDFEKGTIPDEKNRRIHWKSRVWIGSLDTSIKSYGLTHSKYVRKIKNSECVPNIIIMN